MYWLKDPDKILLMSSICKKCIYKKKCPHYKGSCLAKCKKCAVCNSIGHFTNAKVCWGWQQIQQISLWWTFVDRCDEGRDSDRSDDNDNSVLDTAIGWLMKGLDSFLKVKDEEIVKVFLNGKETLNQANSGFLIWISEFRKLWHGMTLHCTSVKFIPNSIK